MKAKILSALMIASLSLVSCGHDEATDDKPEGDLSSVRITVADSGFATGGAESVVRDFVPGDKIGVFAVRESALVEGQSNICYVASDNGMGGIVWTSEAETGAYFSDARYFAYYPYSEELSFVPDPSADDASGFFAGLISSYEVPDDQRMKETFDSADLMIGMASVSGGNNAAFVMEHAMSLILIGLPLEYYSFDNTDYAVPDYVIGGSRNAVFDGFTPFCGEGHVYRYLSRPGEAADFAGTYEDHGGETHAWSETVNTESGKCFSILVDGGIVRISHTLSIGDFFLADGRLLSKDAPADEVASSDVIGVVYQIDPERFDPAIADTLGAVHALVLGTKYVKELPDEDAGYYHWGPLGLDESLIGFDKIYGSYELDANYRLADRDIFGYSHMVALKSHRADRYAAGEYQVFSAVDGYSEVVAGPLETAPANTGWYLPAVGEWFDIIRGMAGFTLDLDGTIENASDGAGQFFWYDMGDVVAKMNVPMEKISAEDKDEFFVGGAIWTSSIADNDAARAVSFNNEGYVHCRWAWKDLGYFARAVLAF